MRSRVVVGAVVLAVGIGGAAAVTGSWSDEGTGDASPDRSPRDSAISANPLRHEPGDAMLTQRVIGGVPERAYARAEAQAEALPLAPTARRAALRWRTAGPTSIGGRLVDVALDPERRRVVYVGAASGGVWRSTDAGRTFQPAWPRTYTQAIGALAMGSDGTLWAGTGETNPGGGSTTYAGDGLYRSRDGGRSWDMVGLANSSRIGRIVVDPTDPDRVFVAVSGDLFTPGGPRGLYRTEDGGRTWQRVLTGLNPTSAAVDVAVDASDPDRVYTTFWDHQRTEEVRRYGGPGSRAYRSTDGGETWRRMRPNLPGPPETNGRLGIAIAPSRPDRLYLTHVNNLGGFAGFFRSDDAGRTWRQMPDTPLIESSQSSYGWWFGRVWVTPDDASDVWVAGVPLIRSRDGGLTWLYGANDDVHVDQHAMVWDLRFEDRIYLGNDGGLYRTDDDGLTWTKAVSEPYTQFYTVDVGQQTPSRIVGGTQDNGCNRSYGPPREWNTFSCGDGLETLINPRKQRIVYACSQYGFCSRSDDGGETEASFYGNTVSDRRNWKTPLEFQPGDPSVMYYAGNVLNRSTDGGRTWTAISPDLTGGPGDDPQYPFGTITSVVAARSDPERLYVGTDDSRIWTSANQGDDWTRIDTAALPDRWVTRVRTGNRDADVVYVTLSGFRQGVDSAHVYRSRNAGRTWTNISSNLPNAPVNDLVVASRKLWVANDIGVYVSSDGGDSWASPAPGLPRTPVMELRWHRPSQTLTAGTFGRGIYRLSVG